MQFTIVPCIRLQYRYVNLKLVIWQVGAVVLYTYVFQMLAPPLEETFDNLEEEKLPISTPVNAVNNGVPEQVPLLTPQKPEAIIMLESSKRGKVRNFCVSCSFTNA